MVFLAYLLNDLFGHNNNLITAKIQSKMFPDDLLTSKNFSDKVSLAFRVEVMWIILMTDLRANSS